MKFAVSLGMAAVMLLALGAAPATEPDDLAANTTARSLIQKLLGEVLVILRNPQLSKAQKSQGVRQIAYEHIDFEVLSRLTMARNWRGLTDEQKAEFIKEFTTHLSATYSHITDNYTDQDLTVTGDRQEPNGDWTVQTHIVGKKGDDAANSVVDVDYRLRQRDGHWKMIDVTVDGVSLVANFRSQFQEIMANGGFDQLMQLLRQKNAADQP